MAEVKIAPDVLGELIMLFVRVGIPEGIKLLGRLKENEITAEKVRALRAGLKPPVNYGEGS